mmetsp:Transcript_44873/g.130721  ORF Transcript_44873/g.130721 Transcript_44873/m.130721 type:complete len:214 (+) Transcript_44873:2097-2738(+)
MPGMYPRRSHVMHSYLPLGGRQPPALAATRTGGAAAAAVAAVEMATTASSASSVSTAAAETGSRKKPPGPLTPTLARGAASEVHLPNPRSGSASRPAADAARSCRSPSAHQSKAGASSAKPPAAATHLGTHRLTWMHAGEQSALAMAPAEPLRNRMLVGRPGMAASERANEAAAKRHVRCVVGTARARMLGPPMRSRRRRGPPSHRGTRTAAT